MILRAYGNEKSRRQPMNSRVGYSNGRSVPMAQTCSSKTSESLHHLPPMRSMQRRSRDVRSSELRWIFGALCTCRLPLRPLDDRPGIVSGLLHVSSSMEPAAERLLPPPDAQVVVESSGGAGLAVLSPRGSAAAVRFGCTDLPHSGGLTMHHHPHGRGERGSGRTHRTNAPHVTRCSVGIRRYWKSRRPYRRIQYDVCNYLHVCTTR